MAKEYSFKSKDHEVLGVTPKDVALELARITKKTWRRPDPSGRRKC